jgi:type IV pilus assembly protein PilC
MQFVCRVGTPEGQVFEQVRQASNEASLRGELERSGLHIFDVRRRGFLGRLAMPNLRSRSKRLPTRHLLVFNQELAALLRAGLPLLQSLNLVVERQTHATLRETLMEIRNQVEGGLSFSEAVASFGDQFPPLYAPTLMAGERSGNMEEVLDRFVRYQRLVGEASKRVVSALVYPAVLVGLSMILITVMLVYVVPGFESFFSDLGTELPVITRIIMAASDLLLDYWIWWLAALLAVLVLAVQMAGGLRGSIWLDRLKVRLPLLGTILHRFALSEFCRSLATLLDGGTPLVSALQVSSQAVSNAYIAQRLSPVPAEVSEGMAFHQSLESTDVVPELAISMVTVGEATGELGTMLNTISDFLDDEVETQLQRMLSLVEPLMLVIMGVVVATLLIAVYLPLSSALSGVK